MLVIPIVCVLTSGLKFWKCKLIYICFCCSIEARDDLTSILLSHIYVLLTSDQYLFYISLTKTISSDINPLHKGGFNVIISTPYVAFNKYINMYFKNANYASVSWIMCAASLFNLWFIVLFIGLLEPINLNINNFRINARVMHEWCKIA